MAVDHSSEKKISRLRTWNIVVGLILAVQAVMIAVLTNNFSLPVTATFMNGPPGTAPSLHHFLTLRPVGAFLPSWLYQPLALLIIASPAVFPWYKRNLLQTPQLRALDRVFLQLFDYDRAYLPDMRHQRYRSPD